MVRRFMHLVLEASEVQSNFEFTIICVTAPRGPDAFSQFPREC